MKALNFPQYNFRLQKQGDKVQIFSQIRKLWIILTPEEWVRQHVVQYLLSEKKYPASLIAEEVSITVNELSKRCDIVIFDNVGKPRIIVECKSPDVKISQKVFDQVALYNIKLKVDFLLVTNGMVHICSKIDYNKNNFIFLTEIPNYEEIKL